MLEALKQTRKSVREPWDIGDEQEGDEHCQEERDGFARYVGDGGLADATPDEEAGADGRGAEADAEVGNHNNAEVDRGETELEGHRQEDGGEDEQGRGHIHKEAHPQQEQVDGEEDDDGALAQSHQGLRDRLGDVGHCHNPAHGA